MKEPLKLYNNNKDLTRNISESQKKRKNRAVKVLEEIMAENISNLSKDKPYSFKKLRKLQTR